MKQRRKGVLAGVAAIVLALYPLMAIANAPRVHSSGYGDESSAVTWNLFGPTHLLAFSGVDIRVQVRCNLTLGDTVEAALGNGADPTKAGGCDLGSYIFLFQIASGPQNLDLTFSNLANFTYNDNPNVGAVTVGIMECDPRQDPNNPNSQPPNTASICTNASASQELILSKITVTHKGNTEVTFSIPQVPKLATPQCTPSATMSCHEQNGLTLFLATGPVPQGGAVLPMSMPRIQVN
jgi:hypothetical protein